MQETQVQPLGQEDPLEGKTATHSSILAWRIPWTEEPGRPPSMGSQRVRHDLATKKQQTPPVGQTPDEETWGSEMTTRVRFFPLCPKEKSNITWRKRFASYVTRVPKGCLRTSLSPKS